MANEAFALSPISARAAEPTEADYDAIREAFMETARGRWFLGEYAKRNRNADTRMVLDAVAKIEESLAAQRQPVIEDRVPEVLAAIRRAVREAETAAGAALDPAAIEESLGPIRRGVRIIKEISWRWREIGADGRICDLIDSQLAAIDGACGQLSIIDPRPDLREAFDLLKDQIEEAGAATAKQAAPTAPPMPAQEAAETAAESTMDVEAAAAASQVPVAEMPQAAAAPAFDPSAAPSGAGAPTDTADAIEPTSGTAEIMESPSALEARSAEAAAAIEAVDQPPLDAAAEAEDDAVLERIALEMAAPDPEFDEAMIEPAEVAPQIEAQIAAEAAVAPPVAAEEPAAPEPITAEAFAQLSEAIAEAAVAVMERPDPQVTQAAALPMPSPVAEPSLGASILASGMLQTPSSAANDPLAPIRRMTQAEKIAFFS